MFETINQTFRAITDIFEMAVGDIGFEHGDNLVISFCAVNHAQAANGKSANEEVAVRESFFREHADVHRVAVAFDDLNVHALRTEFSYTVAAESLRNETVERRTKA